MKICVYAICKNEAKFVQQWLNNVSEADYIVVLDTGSTDGTYKMLKEDSRVTRVERKVIKPWRFDVARNESLALVPDDTDICVCTDFDELFEPGWAQVIRDNWKPGVDRFFYTYAWSHTELGEPSDIFKYDKIHTKKNYHWIYPVHEVLQFEPKDRLQNVIDVQGKIFLHHYPDKTKDRKFYFDLLKLSTEENPTDCHVQMLYAREFLLRGDKTSAELEYLKCLRMPEIDEPRRKEVLLHCLITLAAIYEEKKKYDLTIWYCHEFIKTDPTFREPYLLLSEVYNIMGLYTLSEAHCKTALEYCYQHYSWVERKETYLGWLEDVLSVAQYHLGKLEEARINIEAALTHNPNNVRILQNYTFVLKDLLDKKQQ